MIKMNEREITQEELGRAVGITKNILRYFEGKVVGQSYLGYSMLIDLLSNGHILLATGIRVQNYTLSDIQTLGMPMLEQLIREFYVPEFARQVMDNPVASIEKTKRMIEIWG